MSNVTTKAIVINNNTSAIASVSVKRIDGLDAFIGIKLTLQSTHAFKESDRTQVIVTDIKSRLITNNFNEEGKEIPPLSTKVSKIIELLSDEDSGSDIRDISIPLGMSFGSEIKMHFQNKGTVGIGKIGQYINIVELKEDEWMELLMDLEIWGQETQDVVDSNNITLAEMAKKEKDEVAHKVIAEQQNEGDSIEVNVKDTNLIDLFNKEMNNRRMA